MLTVGQHYSECGTDPVLVASESPAQVALSVRVVVVSDLQLGCDRGSASLQVRLSAPLGKRKLVDGATGLPVLQFSARQFLRPRLLPPGYRLWLVRPMLAAPQGTSEGQPVAGAQQFYSPPPARPEQQAVDQLIITEYVDRPFVPGPWQCLPQARRPPADEGQWTPVRVRGVWGCAASGGIAWRQHGLDYSIGIDSPVGTRPLLSTAQLIAIAASAPG